MYFVIAILQCLLLVALAPLVSGLSRWMRAKMHTRKGPPIMQDYYDLAKLFKRQDLQLESSTFISRIMPALFLGTILVIACGVPMITRFSPIPVLGDVITIIYLMALPRFFFALAGVDRSNPYAGVGSVRELLIGVLVEPSMMLALLATAMITTTMNVGEMGMMISTLSVPYPVATVMAAIAFGASCYIELGKLPYDMAEAEQELQEGPLAEYSGPSFAIIKLALSCKQLLVVSLFMSIFLPFGSAVELTPIALLIGLVVYLVKLFIAVEICAVIENTVSRVRYKYLGSQTWAVVGIALVAFVFVVIGI